MKKIKIITSSSELEQFVNRTDIEIIQMDIKAVEQNIFAQEWFIAVIFYTEGNKCISNLLSSTLISTRLRNVLEDFKEHNGDMFLKDIQPINLLKYRNVDNGKIPKFNAVNNEALPEQKEPPTRLRRLGGYINAKLYCPFGSWRCRGLAICHKGNGVHNPANTGNVRRYVSGTGILQRHYL